MKLEYHKGSEALERFEKETAASVPVKRVVAEGPIYRFVSRIL